MDAITEYFLKPKVGPLFGLLETIGRLFMVVNMNWQSIQSKRLQRDQIFDQFQQL